MSDEKIEYKTSAQVAKVFRMTSKRVQQLTADGIIQTTETPKGRRYDWDKTVEKYVAYLADKAYGREQKELSIQLEEDKLKAEVSIKQTKAKVTQMELEELQGKLHRAEDVEVIMTDHVLFLRSMLMAMPGKLAVDLAGDHTAADQAERVRNEVYYILNQLADYKYDPEAYKKRVMERQGWENSRGDSDDGGS